MSQLELRSLSKSYGALKVFEGLGATVKRFRAIMNAARNA